MAPIFEKYRRFNNEEFQTIKATHRTMKKSGVPSALKGKRTYLDRSRT